MESGPGVNMSIQVDIVSFFLQLILIWFSFLLIFCSKPKGKPKFKLTSHHLKKNVDLIQEDHCCCCDFNISKGGRLKCFMFYDLITFILCVGIFLLCIFIGGKEKTGDLWRLKSHLYFVRIIYGLLSFPFLIFQLPFIQNILTKSRPTAYDK